MRWACSWEAIATGVLVFVMWVGIDQFIPGENFRRFLESLATYKDNPLWGWGLTVARILGMTLVVYPCLRKSFSVPFFYRYFIRTDFLNLPWATGIIGLGW